MISLKNCCVFLLATGVVLTGVAKAEDDKDTNHVRDTRHLKHFSVHHHSSLIGHHSDGLLKHLGHHGHHKLDSKLHHLASKIHGLHHKHRRSISDEDNEQPASDDSSRFDETNHQHHQGEGHIPIEENVPPKSGIFTDVWTTNQQSKLHHSETHAQTHGVSESPTTRQTNDNIHHSEQHHNIQSDGTHEFLRKDPQGHDVTTPREPFKKSRSFDDPNNQQADHQADEQQRPQSDDTTNNFLGKDPLGHDIITPREPFKKSRSFDEPIDEQIEHADHQANRAQNDETHYVFRTTPSSPFKKSRSVDEPIDDQADHQANQPQNEETNFVSRSRPDEPLEKPGFAGESDEEQADEIVENSQESDHLDESGVFGRKPEI